MCGLFGYFNLDVPDRAQRSELFRQLARKAQVRGTDSWGAAYERKGRSRLQHGLGPISKRLARDNKMTRSVSASNVLLGHTRAASRGEIALRNSHPFAIGGFIGAHNGMLSNSSDLQTSARYIARGESDSEEALAWLVSEGLTPAAFEELQGWYALTIIKEDLTELIIAVDARTPFAIARIGGGIVWHSLAVALESSLQAVGLEAEVQEIKNQLLRFPSDEAINTAPPTPVTRRLPIMRPDDVSFMDLMGREDQFALDFGGEA